MFRWWGQLEGAGFVGGVVHPGEAEEEFTVFGDALEEIGLGERLLADAGAEQAPEVVVVARHADLPGLVGRPEGFLMEQAGLFPERALGGEHPDGEGRCGVEGWEVLGHVG